MFAGHYGVAFALKRLEPRVSLGALFVAVQLVDIMFGATTLLGWEHARIVPGYMAASPIEFLDYPITHSLLAGLAWGTAAALVYFSWPTRNVSHHWRAALVVGLAVLSHWPLDVLMHGPDLPLAGAGSARVGLGLWNNVALSVGVELVVVAVGVAIYATLKSRRHPVRPARLAVLLGVILLVWLGSMLGPPPSSMHVVGAAIIGLCLLIALIAWWADRAVPEAVAAHRHAPRHRHG